MSAHGPVPAVPVPGYLGRVLDAGGAPAGTCFQAAPGLLVTAWHVLDSIGAGELEAEVSVDPLAGGSAFGGTVAALDAVHDLAVIRAQEVLAASVAGWDRTDAQQRGAEVVITGAPEVEDVHDYRFLDARGTCEGGTVRDDAVPLGRAKAQDVLPGMSGAPVRRARDDYVIGVLSARYNSADGWLQHSIWIARTENLALLLDGLTPVELPAATLPADGVELTLHIGPDEVQLTGAGPQPALAVHQGVRPALVTALDEVRRARLRASAEAPGDVHLAAGGGGAVYRGRGTAQVVSVAAAVHRAGRLLTDAFVTGDVAKVLAGVLRQAEREHKPVRLAVRADGPTGRLPWEMLTDPDTGLPLALRPQITLYRKTPTHAASALPGPLRILVAVSGPEDSGGGTLDYERELRNVLASVRSARQGRARVRIVPFATTAAIRAALERERFHILHLSGHGNPGQLELEDEEGQSRLVDADTFITEAVPAGRMPSVVALAACHTAVGDSERPSFAAGLAAHGAAAVIATETSITDIYATRVFARIYSALADHATADLIQAVAQARRTVHTDLARSPNAREHKIAALEEWSTLTVLAAAGTLPLLPGNTADNNAGSDQRESGGEGVPAQGRPRLDGLVVRPEGDFVGRRREQRAWPRTLDSPATAGLVLHGIGGIGKTTLAAELVLRMQHLRPAWIHTGLTGEISADDFFTAVTDPFLSHPPAAPGPGQAHAQGQLQGWTEESGPVLTRQQHAYLLQARRSDLAWQQRLKSLRRAIGDIPVLVSLDNFEDNLATVGVTPAAGTADSRAAASYTTATGQDEHSDPGGMRINDPDLAGLLAAWVLDPGDSKLLITSRFPFLLPGHAHDALVFEHLGPLTHAETLKLAWSLPALDRLTEPELTRVWHLVGGHPRALEYLDALLNNRVARYPDVTHRLAQSLRNRQRHVAATPAPSPANGTATAAHTAGENRGNNELEGTGSGRLDVRLAETATLAADEVLLPGLTARLSPAARTLLNGAAVYREPIDINALLFQTGTPDDTAATTPDTAAAWQRINDILTAAGIPLDQPVDAGTLPTGLQQELAPHLVQMRQLPTPPRTRPAGLEQLIAQCAGTGLLHTDPRTGRFFVHRWTATELHRHTHSDFGIEDIRQAHRNAAAYWLWRVSRWPQDPDANIHDGLEARHHLLQAGELEQAAEATESAFATLRDRSAWNRARTLIITTLAWLPSDSPRHAAWTLELGNLAYLQGDYDEARRLYEHSLEAFQRLGNQSGTATSYHQLGIIAQDQGDYDEARRLYQQSLDIEERLGNQAGAASSYGQLGNLAYDQGDYDEARRLYQQSLDTFQRLGDQAGTATVYHQLGMIAYLQGDYDQARRLYQQSLDTFQHLGNQASTATVYHQLGNLAYRQGDYDQARRLYQHSLDIKQRLGNQAGAATSYHQLGMIAQEQGDHDEARRLYQHSLDIKQRLGNQAGAATSYGQLGNLAHDLGDYDQARRLYQHSLDTFQRLGDQTGAATSHLLLGNLAQQEGSWEEAVSFHGKALMVFVRLQSPHAVTCLRQLGACREALGDERFAVLLCEQAGQELTEMVMSLLNEDGENGE
ncbi:tetratricopeptide repeat protein [Streptomyces sp. CA-135486]|uniref:tetratricopeptide repeat protein n=1 Tax=Streptomyces sp. CA-135486 TaxID=3240049 RepID=UPI003D93E434